MAKRIYCQDCPVREYCDARKKAYRQGELEVLEHKECPLIYAVALKNVAKENDG